MPGNGERATQTQNGLRIAGMSACRARFGVSSGGDEEHTKAGG